MKTFRVVCTTDTSKENNNLIVDFAAADINNATITHDNLLRLRQDKTPSAEAILPPLNIHDDNGNYTLAFEKPQTASEEAITTLEHLTPRIKLEYEKFKHRRINATLEITSENLSVAYGFADPYKIVAETPEQAEFKERMIESQRIRNTKAMQRNMEKKHPPLYITGYRNRD